jgi:hypothetical protein
MQDTRHRGLYRGLGEAAGRTGRQTPSAQRLADDLRKRVRDCIQNGRIAISFAQEG